MVSSLWSVLAFVALFASSTLARRPDFNVLSGSFQQQQSSNYRGAHVNHGHASKHELTKEEQQKLALAKPFQELHKKYFSKYAKGLPRTLENLKASDVTIDYEFELSKHIFPQLPMTPELLLMRGGIRPEHFQATGVFDSGSSLLSVDMDGIGSPHYQSINGNPEVDSVVMRPTEALNGGLFADFDKYMERKVHIQRGTEPRKRVFQYTYGMPMSKLTSVLSKHADKGVRKLVKSAEDICLGKEGGCTPEYQGFLPLAAMVIKQAAGCGDCRFAKRCQSPWLVRTNFGDMAQRLRKEERSQLTEDVLSIWQGDADEPLYPKGIMDYLHFPEMAEIGGLVQSRGALATGKQLTSRVMPTDPQGLLQLATDMLERKTRRIVQKRLRTRGCAINGAGRLLESPTPSARQWLEAMQKEGKDLMSDHHSPLTKESLSGTVWRSMGQWRMQPGEENQYRVHLECRKPQECLGLPDEDWLKRSYKSMLGEPARFAMELADQQK